MPDQILATRNAKPVQRHLCAKCFSFKAPIMAQSKPVSANQPLVQIVKNASWLLGGKGFGAVSSLLYLAILSRTLGVKDFGHFALIFGFSQAICAIASFQTWQIIVRYGSIQIAKDDWNAFARLAVAGGLIDAAGALAGSLLAIFVVVGFGEALELNPEYSGMALAFICAMLWARVSAPYGIIRALDRFELTVFVGAITPAGRLLAALLIWLTGPSVGRFLLAWALIEFITAAAIWITAWRLRPDLMKLARLAEWRQAISDNPGIVKFTGITYCNTSLQAVVHQGPLLAVGFLFGTSAAGVYRIADQLAKGLSKLALLISDAVYPEVNRHHHQAEAREFSKVIARVTASVVVIAVVVSVLAMFLGDDLLTLIAGAAFASGAVILVPLVIAASFELAAVAYEPVLHAFGKPHYQFYVRLAAAIVLTALVFSLLVESSVGVAWAVVATQAFEFAALSLLVFAVLRRAARR